MDSVIGGNPLDHLAVIVRLHGDWGFEFRAVGATLDHEWESPFQGRYAHSVVNDGGLSRKTGPPESAQMRGGMT